VSLINSIARMGSLGEKKAIGGVGTRKASLRLEYYVVASRQEKIGRHLAEQTRDALEGLMPGTGRECDLVRTNGREIPVGV